MNKTDATLTNGRYELPAHARGVLVLADPPEAGWRLEFPPDEGSQPKLNRTSRSHPATGSGRYRPSPENLTPNLAPSASGNRSEEGARSA
jgi:hypothetical protein